jgi:hypothetical protein
MAKAKNKTCLDCLHCKVSAKSTENRRLCFCAMAKKEERHGESFWSEKKVCGEFDSMGAHITPHSGRRPLLKGVDFLSGVMCR